MEVDFIFKIAAIGIIVAVLYQVLSRSGREEYATLTVIAEKEEIKNDNNGEA
jgi:stage III sporulation protein AC